MSKSKVFAYSGYLGYSLLQLMKEVAAERTEVESEADKKWQFTATSEAFHTAMVEPFRSGTADLKPFITFKIRHPEGEDPEVAEIRVRYGIPTEDKTKIPPQAGFIAKIEAIRFSLTREQIKLPSYLQRVIQNTEVKSLDALNNDIIYNIRLVPPIE